MTYYLALTTPDAQLLTVFIIRHRQDLEILHSLVGSIYNFPT